MEKISQKLKSYIETHPFDSGDDDCATVLDQLYLAYANSHESDPTEISEGFKELEEFLHTLPLSDNNAVCNSRCIVSGDTTAKRWCYFFFVKSAFKHKNQLL